MIRTLLLLVSLTLNVSVFAQTHTLCDKWVDCGNSCQLLDPYYSEGVTFTWSGPSHNGKAHGTGVAKKYKNGELESTYEGEYKDGIREGHGRFTHVDGTIKEGTFVNGQLMGKGKCWDDEGLTYEGSFINYRMHGEGKIKVGNGTTFEGFLVSDRPYTGKITYYDGTEIYIQAGERVEKIKEKKTNYSPKMGVMQTEYFDEDWNRCEGKDAAYYRHVTYKAPNTPDGIVKDYYITGELQNTYTAVYMDYNDDGKTFHEGEALWYYKNGVIKEHRYYYNNRINGPYKLYDEYGNMRVLGNYDHGTLDGEWRVYNADGSIYSYTIYENGSPKNGKSLRFGEDNEDPYFVYDIDFDDLGDDASYSGPVGVTGLFHDSGTTYLAMTAYPDQTISSYPISTKCLSDDGAVMEITTYRKSSDDNVISLVWGWKDWKNCNVFSIAGNHFVYGCMVRGQEITGSELQYCNYIEENVNKLTVSYSGDAVRLYINGYLVVEESDIVMMDDACFVSYSNFNGDQEPCIFVEDMTLSTIATEKEVMAYVESYTPADGWKGSGSGFFVSSDGYIATNNHVVRNANTIEVTFQRNGVAESHTATVVQADRQNDLAILKISDDNFTPMDPLPYSISTAVKETGSEVFTLGYPLSNVLGSEVKFTDGKISAKTGVQGDVTMYQISVPIQSGNSGGPLFDSSGNLVGITSAQLNKDYFNSENVNYAIKSSYLQSLVDVLPVHIDIQQSAPTSNLTLTEKIKSYKDYIVQVKVK